MRRPPIACRRAVQPLQSVAQNHVWISDDLLAATLRQFFRVGCGHQKRHGSHVPGPLEARKRAAKRQMTIQANAVFEPSGLPLFNLGALFGGRANAHPSWKYEPPTLTPSHPPGRSTSHKSEIVASAVEVQNVQEENTELAEESSSFNPKATDLHARLAALEDAISASPDLNTYMTHIETWMSLTRGFGQAKRLEAFKSACKRRRFVKRKAQEATLRLLQCLIRHDWNPDAILSWLLERFDVLPSPGTSNGSKLLRQLTALMIGYRRQTPRILTPANLGRLYARIACPLLHRNILDARTAQILYRARWGLLVDLHPEKRAILEKIAVLLIDVHRSPHTNHGAAIADSLLKYLTPLVKAGHISASLLDQVSELLPRSLLYPLKSAVEVGSEQDKNARDSNTGSASAKTFALTGATSTAKALDLREYFDNLEFQNLIQCARNANIIPKWYGSLNEDMCKEMRGHLIHQIAQQYAMASTRGHRQNWRRIRQLYDYLQRYDFPIKPTFSEAVAEVGLVRPLSINSHVSTKKLTWILDLVTKVEGEDRARELGNLFWLWRGELIRSAGRTSRLLGGPNMQYMNTLKKLGIT